MVALLVVGVVGAYGYARFRFSQVKRISVPGLSHRSAGAGGAMTILLVGNNSREVLDGTQTKAFGSGSDVGGARSDVTMLLHLDPATGRAAMLSIPRDLFVPLSPHSMAGAYGKIDGALNDGPNGLVT